jgi:zinc transporter, ZIP family
VFSLLGLFYTFLTGVFFLIGIYLNKIFKNKENATAFAVSLAFVVLLNLICCDIIPEILEEINFISIIFIIIGICILKLFDLFIPNHTHNHSEKNDDKLQHSAHLTHISIITILALTLHNIVECMALFTVTNSNIKAGSFMFLAIILHNIPLGFQIGNSIKKSNVFYILILVFSGFFGGIISFFIGTISITNYILSFTLGMLLYLFIFELFKEFIHEIKNKYSIIGIIIGIIIILVLNIYF